jgi:lipoate-protein ligase B
VTISAVDLGFMPYKECFQLQQQILELVASGALGDTLLFVEHPPVYSLGASFHKENLPLSEEEYERLGVAIEPTDRGGDITYHGPGQLIAYPIFHLERYGKDLHNWLRNLEQWVIDFLGEYHIFGRRFAPHTGVWIDDRKICAIGIKVRRWVSMHGIALNVANDLAPFNWIVPCGIQGYGVTSLANELGIELPLEEVRTGLVNAIPNVFHNSVEWLDKEPFLENVSRLCDTNEPISHPMDSNSGS